jgi:CBS domain containing-hemolysin-like protein
VEIISVVICLVLSALFSGIEIAFFSANRLKIELAYQRGTVSGKILHYFYKDPSKFIITTLLSNNIVLVVFGMMMARLIEQPLHLWLGSPFWAMILQTVISTTILIFLGEFIPKVLFKVFADTLLPFFSIPFYGFFWLLRIGVILLNAITNGFMKLFNVQKSSNDIIYTSVDLEKFIKDHTPKSDTDEQEVDTELFENALSLKTLKVRDCMVPRKEIIGLDANSSIADLKDIIIRTYHSRILVYNQSIDNILGYVHHFDMHKKPENIKSILLPIKIVPEIMPIQKLLNTFIKEGKSIAWVVNEYGGTAGIITLEDILEEIFGEIDDEYDKDEYIENQLSQNEYILSGRLEIDYLNDKYNLLIPEGEYETLSGFITSIHESIPQKDEIIEIGNYLMKIIDVSDTKIETVKLSILKDEEKMES